MMLVGALVALVIFVLPALGLIKSYRAPTEAMVPAIERGDRFLVLKAGYEPKVGQLAVFRAPSGAVEARCGEPMPAGQMCALPTPGRSNVTFVKRIVAGPGDRVRMEDGRLFRNDRPESGYELRPCNGRESCDFPSEITVPDGHFFVLGDNRGASADSRFWGPVPEEHFEGRHLLTYIKG